MTKSALSVYMYGLFLIMGIGFPFVVMPHDALGLFGLAAGDDVWVRLVGLLSGIMGGFYVMAVQTDMEPFYMWTVPARFCTMLFHVVMVLLGHVGLAILLFAAIDALAGALTWLALRSETEELPA